MAKGLLVAAPHSGSGKTLFTLGLLRALKARGVKLATAKAGPDYIDPGFHAAAAGTPCINLDIWAMGPGLVQALAARHAAKAELLVVEGVMGLFDGPQGARGSSADLATALGLPVLLVVDAARQGQSVAALVHGFRDFRKDITLAGVILNRVASDKHEAILRAALECGGIQVLGALRQSDSRSLPSRHLGLVQAEENQQLEAFIESAASGVARETFLDNILESAWPLTNQRDLAGETLPPPGQTIAIARDRAFSFLYPHLLQGWARQGAELRFFSPLADESPPAADMLFLPGGYPELHAGRLSANSRFLNGLKQFPGLIYGECGGYMVLGQGLIDAQGERHAMAGLLPLTTSFAARKLHLGYRRLKPLAGPWLSPLRGHEFHYSTLAETGGGEALFEAQDAAGLPLGPMGQRMGRVMGSYAHVISQAPAGEA